MTLDANYEVGVERERAKQKLHTAVNAEKQARLKLALTRITAPTDGSVGRVTVRPSQLVNENQTEPLAVVQQLNPIYVSVAQTELTELQKDLEGGQLERDQGNLPAKLIFNDGRAYSADGVFYLSHSPVELTTGYVRSRAVFPNHNNALVPNMRVRIDLVHGLRRYVIPLPAEAFIRDSSGATRVMVLDAENKVWTRLVNVAPLNDAQWAVTKGLAVGDRVIVQRPEQVRPGTEIRLEKKFKPTGTE